MVEEDVGREVALAVARRLVVFLKRPGGQSQFSAQLAGQLAERQPLGELQAWIADHLDEDLSVEHLAERAAMSVRNFSRTFRREVGVTPARFVERARVDGPGVCSRSRWRRSSRSPAAAASARPRPCAARSCAPCA
jgi:transcriptional regulator GlxA family with amidase domain